MAFVSIATSVLSSNAQSDATANAQRIQQQQYDSNKQTLQDASTKAQALLAPFKTSGVKALDQLNQAMGLKGGSGTLNQPYGLGQYQQDPGYTPLVASEADLAATPGYRWQLQQGLQAANNSAAARGSLLSGAQLKSLNDYAQGQADGTFQSAWNRGQTAYNNAFQRNNSQQSNQFARLQSLADNGQSAASNQGQLISNAAASLAGTGQVYGNTAANLAQVQGQNQAQLYGGVNNSLQSFLGYGLTAGSLGGGGWFG